MEPAMRKLLAALFVLFPFWATAQPLVGPVPEPFSFAAATYTESTKPTVTASQAGLLAYISDCANGNQTLPGSGCLSFVNSSGLWIDLSSPANQPITIGGQTLYLGQASVNQGNGPKIQLATGAFVAGHAIAYDANGNAIDSGGAAQGGGTVSSGGAGTLAYYSSAGQTVISLPSVNNGV